MSDSSQSGSGDLFIRLYLDEDVLLADLVRARGFDAETTQEARQIGATDAEQLAYAVNKRKALLTHNRADFEQLAHDCFAAGRTHQGILIAVRRPPYDLANRVLAVLNAVTADEIQDQVRYL